jgi:ribosomal protein L40E
LSSRARRHRFLATGKRSPGAHAAERQDARRRRFPKIVVERPGAARKSVTAPPGTCEGCGCDLSRYRAADETNCWACLNHKPAPLLPAERERRVAAFLAGRSVPHRVDHDFVCRECGGLKSAGARRCARCRYKAPHPKKPTNQSLKGGPCPVCGGKKTPKARLCRLCSFADQRLLFARNPAVTCPDCGGPKVRKAKRCRRCRNRHDYGTIYVNGRPLELTCPDCGGPKKLKRASRCRACATRNRWRKGYASKALGRRGVDRASRLEEMPEMNEPQPSPP